LGRLVLLKDPEVDTRTRPPFHDDPRCTILGGEFQHRFAEQSGRRAGCRWARPKSGRRRVQRGRSRLGGPGAPQAGWSVRCQVCSCARSRRPAAPRQGRHQGNDPSTPPGSDAASCPREPVYTP